MDVKDVVYYKGLEQWGIILAKEEDGEDGCEDYFCLWFTDLNLTKEANKDHAILSIDSNSCDDGWSYNSLPPMDKQRINHYYKLYAIEAERVCMEKYA